MGEKAWEEEMETYVVAVAALAVAQNAGDDTETSELLLNAWHARVLVRVQLHRALAVRLGELSGGRILLNAKVGVEGDVVACCQLDVAILRAHPPQP